VLVLAAAGTTFLALTKNNDAEVSAIAAHYTPPTLPHMSSAASAPPSTAPSATATPTPTSSAPASVTPHHVVFLGDGYTADGGSDAAHRFPVLVGAAEKWDVQVVSCELASYASTGNCGSDYAGLIPKIAASHPDIVVITGGRNDVANASGTAAAATAFFTQLSTALPGATVYAVSPLWDDDPADAALGTVQQSVQAAAAASGATYLDIGEPLRGHPELVKSDGVVPNNAGNAAIAQAIEGKLPAQP
jgi:lysophospholipase L1-like esterase